MSRGIRVLKAGTLYFGLAFAAGWVLGPIRELWVIPRLGRTAGFLLEAHAMLVVIIVAARCTVRRLAIPSTRPARLAMGGVELGLLLVAEIIGVLWVRRLSVRDYVASFDLASGAISLVMFLLFAAMPLFVQRSHVVRPGSG